MKIKNICQDRTVVTGETVTLRISQGKFDQIYLSIRSTSGLNLIAEDETVPVLVTLVQGGRSKVLADCSLDDLLMHDDFKGGFSGYNGADGVTKRFKLDCGTIDLQKNDEVTIVISFAAITFVAGKMDVFCLLSNSNTYTRNRAILARTVNTDADFPNVLELYLNDSAAGNTVTVSTVENGDEPYYDRCSECILNLNGNFEAAQTVGFLWLDPTGEGRDVHVKTPSALRIIAICAVD